MQKGIEKILIIDDDEIVHLILKTHLERLSLTSDSAYNGAQMFSKLNQTKYDLIFLDEKIDSESGLELLRNYKNSLNGNQIPQVISCTTSYDESSYIEKAKKLGIELFLPKPIRKQELVKIIESVQYHKSLEKAA